MSQEQVDKLSEEKIQEIILEILSGERLVRQLDQGMTTFIKFTYPPASARQYCDLLEEVSLEKALLDGLPSENDLDSIISECFFSTEDLENLQDLQTKRDSFRKLLSKRIKGTELYLKEQDRLTKIDNEIQVLETKRQAISEFTAEYQARENKYFDLLVKSAYDLEDTLLWASSEQLLDSNNVHYAYSILNKFLDFYWGYGTKIIRKVARSAQWRTMYLSAEKGARLTDSAAKDLPVSYLHLMSWSMYYQSISEMMPSDRPSESIVENDELLDKYMHDYQAKMKKEASSSRSKANKNASSASDKDQVIVTAESKNYVSLHQDDGYSDTAIISGRVSTDKSSGTTYSEIKEKNDQVRARASKKRQRSKSKGIR